MNRIIQEYKGLGFHKRLLQKIQPRTCMTSTCQRDSTSQWTPDEKPHFQCRAQCSVAVLKLRVGIDGSLGRGAFCGDSHRRSGSHTHSSEQNGTREVGAATGGSSRRMREAGRRHTALSLCNSRCANTGTGHPALTVLALDGEARAACATIRWCSRAS